MLVVFQFHLRLSFETFFPPPRYFTCCAPDKAEPQPVLMLSVRYSDIYQNLYVFYIFNATLRGFSAVISCVTD
jgi:hypothetical protein